MHQTPLLLTLVTGFTGFLSTVDRDRYHLRAGHLYRTGPVPASAQPSSPSGETVVTRRSRPHPGPLRAPAAQRTWMRPPGAGQNESMPLTRARQVSGPTIPSTVIPSACWKPRTAVAVWGPKIPSTARG